MASKDFTEKLANLYKNKVAITEDAKLEEDILSQINGLFSASGADPEVYRAAMENIIRIKLDDMKMLKELVANLVKLDAAISKIPSLAKTPDAKKAAELKVQDQRADIKSRIQSLTSDIDKIKAEAKDIAKTIEDAVRNNKQTQKDASIQQKPNATNGQQPPSLVAESFKDWFN